MFDGLNELMGKREGEYSEINEVGKDGRFAEYFVQIDTIKNNQLKESVYVYNKENGVGIAKRDKNQEIKESIGLTENEFELVREVFNKFQEDN